MSDWQLMIFQSGRRSVKLSADNGSLGMRKTDELKKRDEINKRVAFWHHGYRELFCQMSSRTNLKTFNAL